MSTKGIEQNKQSCVVTVRMPSKMHGELKDEAHRQRRSLNGLIVNTLEAMLSGPRNVRFNCKPVGEEVVLRLANGWALVSGCGNYDYTCGEYISLRNEHGKEILYWHYDEWETDPVLVMGAIINAAFYKGAIRGDGNNPAYPS